MVIFQTRQFPDNCVDWTNENVSFGDRNYGRLSKKCSTFCSRGVQVWQNWRHFYRVLETWRHCDFRKIEIWTNLSHRNTGAPTFRCEELLFFNLNANVQLVKRDIVTAVIYYYITPEFHYAKRDSRLSAYWPLQKRERAGKEYGCFPFVWKTKIFKWKIN